MFYQLKWYDVDEKGSCVVSTRDELTFIINIMIKSKIPFMVYNEGCMVTSHEMGCASSEWWIYPNSMTPPHVLDKAGLSDM